MGRIKRKILIFVLSLALAGLYTGLCFLDPEPFYPAKIAGTVILTLWLFSAIPAYIAAYPWMRLRAAELYRRYGFAAFSFGGAVLVILPLLLAPFFMVYYYISKNI